MRIGRFYRSQNGGMSGRIQGLGLTGTTVSVKKETSKEGKEYFRVVADPMGDPYDVGVMFEKQKDNKVFYSVILDTPMLPAPIYATLRPDERLPGQFHLFWDRAEMQKAIAEPQKIAVVA